MEPTQKAKDLAQSLGNEIDEEIHPLLKKITDNIKIIGMVIGVIVLAAAVYTGVGLYKNHSHDQARERLNGIAELSTPQEQIEALAAYQDEAPEAFRQGIRLRIAQLAMEMEDYNRAVEAWDTVAAHGERNIQIVANLGKAKALRLAGDSAAAVEVLQAILSSSPGNYRGPVNLEMASAAEEAGQLDRALNAYQELKAVSAASNQNYLDYKITQLQQRIATNAS